MEGKEAIISRILEAARRSADSLLSEAENEAQAAEDAARANCERLAAEKRAALSAECERMVERRLTLARLEAKKKLLAEKQAVISDAYREARERLAADEKRYALVMARLVAQAAEDGDVVTVGEGDKCLDDKWFASLAGKTKAKLKFGKEKNAERGVILRGRASDKTLTLDYVFADLRSRTEAAVAEILFGEGNGDGK